MPWVTPSSVSTGDVLTASQWNQDVVANLNAVLSSGKVAHFRDEKAANTNGGEFTSGAFRTRVLNTTVVNNITGASLASNQVTLPSGSYFVISRSPAYRVDANQSRIYNITDAAVIITGTNAYSGSIADYAAIDSWAFGFFTLSASKVIELQHRCQTTKTVNGFGVLNNFGANEVYSEILFWKVS